MNAKEIFDRAVLLLGYNDADGAVSGETALQIRTVQAINTVLYELCKHPPISDINAELLVDDATADALVYGVGMILANGEGDGDRGNLFAEIYNVKRAGTRAKSTRIGDVLPVCGG